MLGCYIGGIYVKERQVYPWKRKAFPTFTNSMVNTVNWIEIQVEVDGESFSMGSSEFRDYRRSLDMRQGLLSRELVFKTRSGNETALRWERFVSHDDPHVGAIRLSVKALNHSRPVKVAMALDGHKENRDYANSRVHSRMVSQGAMAADAFLLTNIISTGQYTIHRMLFDTPPVPGLAQTWQASDKRVAAVAVFTPSKGQEYIFDKIVSVWTSREAGYPHGLIPKEEERTEVAPEKEKEVVKFLIESSGAHIARYRDNGYEKARSAHVQKVSHLWDNCDIQIDGDPAGQQGIRYCIFQLLCTYKGNDSYLNIGPKGYSGECYNGRTFWDTESYCLPFYLFMNQATARNLLEFRHNTLDAARKQAELFWYKGAIYPLTTLDGSEDTTVWEYWMGEVHINAVIGYAICIYTQVTGDKSYLYDKGVEVLIELSRFFASRAAFVPYRGGFAINRVTGANEYGQCVNNNWYTNYMAKWLLEYTIEVIDEMRKSAPASLDAAFKRTTFDPGETEHWREVAAKLILNYDPKMDVFIENDMFLSLDPLSREELDRDRDIPIERKWTIEKYQKYQIIKQPDVLLALFLLRHRFSQHEVENNYRFYEQRCVHGSSLSPAIHSILACQIGRYNQAYEYYRWSSRLDLDDFNNNTCEGLHISSMAGSWMNIVCGFGGLMYTGEKLSLSPILPKSWQNYSFKFVYRRNVIQVSVDSRQATLRLCEGESVRLKVYGDEVEVTGQPLSIPFPPSLLNRIEPKAVIFDLDGVIVDTARFHYLAWKRIADEEGIYFDAHINEQLKGVSRMQSLEVILRRASRVYTQAEKDRLAASKNDFYVQLLHTLTEKNILPGIPGLFDEIGNAGLKTAIVSVSRNTDFILERLNLRGRFNVVVTGNDTTKSKPDPEGMLLASKRLDIPPSQCVVIEDAIAGIEAAAAAGMKSIGIGDKTLLHRADYAIPATRYLSLGTIMSLY
jgi:alpha,alpha-trehalose phosphorylase